MHEAQLQFLLTALEVNSRLKKNVKTVFSKKAFFSLMWQIELFIDV